MPADPKILAADDQSAVVDAQSVYNNEIKSIPAPERSIGIDTTGQALVNIANSGIHRTLDTTQLDAFTRVSEGRNNVYNLLDSMTEDSKISAVLETYVEDTTERNEQGQIVWCEASDSKIQAMVTYLLDTLNVDKHIHKWANCLIKYGDLYLKLFHESDFDEADILFDAKAAKAAARKRLTEDVRVRAYKKNDHFVEYVEMEPNPATVFELTKFGKSYAYVKTDINTMNSMTDTGNDLYSSGLMKFRFRKNDVDVYPATSYVHAAIDDTSSRVPEEVQLYTQDVNGQETSNGTYIVRRGKSIFYDAFKAWRQLSLLENSVLLNRVTKSSIIRIISVEVGDMPKEMVGPHLQGVKALIEQKSALAAGESLAEYTNPGPVENNIYIPTHGGVGNITADTIGGDVDVKSLADLEYYQNMLYGSLKVPKQYFGLTDDAAGFSGGSSLAIISSRYAKSVKRIQDALTQAITDIIHIILIDRGLTTYVNEFKIRMLAPSTQEEIDRQAALASKVQLTSDIMNMLSDIEDVPTKLKILNSMLTNVISNNEVTSLIQDYIDKLEAEIEEADKPKKTETETPIVEETPTEEDNEPQFSESDFNDDLAAFDEFEDNGEEDGETATEVEAEVSEPIESDNSSSLLPSADELGIDLTRID